MELNFKRSWKLIAIVLFLSSCGQKKERIMSDFNIPVETDSSELRRQGFHPVYEYDDFLLPKKVVGVSFYLKEKKEYNVTVALKYHDTRTVFAHTITMQCDYFEKLTHLECKSYKKVVIDGKAFRAEKSKHSDNRIFLYRLEVPNYLYTTSND